MEYLLIYLIGIVDDLKEFFNFVGTIGAVSCLGVFFMSRANLIDASEEKEKVYESWARKSFKFFVVFSIIFTSSYFVPNSKTLIAMVTIPPVIHNEQVQQLPENVLGFINDYLKEKRNELQGVSGSSGKV